MSAYVVRRTRNLSALYYICVLIRALYYICVLILLLPLSTICVLIPDGRATLPLCTICCASYNDYYHYQYTCVLIYVCIYTGMPYAHTHTHTHTHTHQTDAQLYHAARPRLEGAALLSHCSLYGFTESLLSLLLY